LVEFGRKSEDSKECTLLTFLFLPISTHTYTMNTKLVAKVGIVLFIFGITICVGYGVVAAFRLSEKNDQEYLQKYRNDFKEVKAGGMDVLDEYSKISTLHTAIKSGFVKSAEIGANDVEVTFLYVLSK